MNPDKVINFQIRMPPELHERLVKRADSDKLSRNVLVLNVIELWMDSEVKS